MASIPGKINEDFVNQMVEATRDLNTGDADSSFDGDMFMQLLLTQLQNQDPFNTVESEEIMRQQAILSEVEQSLKQTESLDSLKQTVDISLAEMSLTLKSINDTLTSLVDSQDDGNNAGGES